jgi:hypothetical protein
MVRTGTVLRSSQRAPCYSWFEISALASITHPLFLLGTANGFHSFLRLITTAYASPLIVAKSSTQDIDGLLSASILLPPNPASPAVSTTLSNLFLQVHFQRHLHLRTIPTLPMSASSPLIQVSIQPTSKSSPSLPPLPKCHLAESSHYFPYDSPRALGPHARYSLR